MSAGRVVNGAMAGGSPARNARIAGVSYALTFLTGLLAFLLRGKLRLAAGLIAAACYVAVTLLFYFLFRPVSRSLSLLAARDQPRGVCHRAPEPLFSRPLSR
jgi:hypothetical protein